MRKLLYILCFIFPFNNTWGQMTNELLEGNVSFFSAEHVYVRFVNTSGLNPGDTLYRMENGLELPVLTVSTFSSISCLCTPIGKPKLTLDTQVYAKIKISTPPIDVQAETSKQAIAVTDPILENVSKSNDSTEFKSHFEGKFGISSYSNFYQDAEDNLQRLRYNLNINAEHIGNSRFSFDSYITFTHKLPKDSTFKISDALKIFSLGVKYDFSQNSFLSFGRRININTLNLGAVDGFQFEQKIKNFTLGALIGSRPDYIDYSVNTKLIEYGGFASHKFRQADKFVQTTIGCFNQTNELKTDRTFGYLQHSNSLLNGVDFFGSMEIDMYQGNGNYQPQITSTYASLRYRPVNKLSLSLTYDARKNVYYYETYKLKADSILDKETRQGMKLQFNYHPFRDLMWSGSLGYRIPTPTGNYSKNAYSFITYNIPFIDLTASVSGTYLNTNTINGMVYGAGLSKDIFDGKLYLDAEYSRVNYTFTNQFDPLNQNILELGITWYVMKKLMLSANYEGTFETDPTNNMSRIFINITQKF